MPSYTASGYQGYTWDGAKWVIDGAPTTATIIATDVNGDNEADVGEDITTQSNDYVGYVDIGGSDYLIVYGSDEVPPGSGNWVTDISSIAVALPASANPSTFPFPAEILSPEITTAPFTYCFAAGTQITTPCGALNVDALTIGDKIMTASGAIVAVKWIGRQTVNTRIGFTAKLEPVRIGAGALGNSLPNSDLTVSADHGMVIDGLVINALALVNGTTIDFVPATELDARFTYYHIETENHDVILANGAPSETFVDIPGRMGFDNYQEYLDLYGTERIIPEMDIPRISTRRLLPDAIKARLGVVDKVIDFDMPLSA